MMRKILAGIYLLASVLLVLYLTLPTPGFPEPPAEFLTSTEPADVEDSLRRGFYTDLPRSEVIEHYQDRYKLRFLGYEIPSYRLNYPPEEAVTLIRDQTQSTYLEEIVYPLRDSLYINGFEVKKPEDEIIRDGKSWQSKVIVKQVKSNVWVREALVLVSLGVGWYLIWNYR